MVKKEIYVKEKQSLKKKYFWHETYNTWKEAIIIAKYYKLKEKSKYYILIDTWSEKQDKYHLYLDNIWNAL